MGLAVFTFRAGTDYAPVCGGEFSRTAVYPHHICTHRPAWSAVRAYSSSVKITIPSFCSRPPQSPMEDLFRGEQLCTIVLRNSESQSSRKSRSYDFSLRRSRRVSGRNVLIAFGFLRRYRRGTSVSSILFQTSAPPCIRRSGRISSDHLRRIRSGRPLSAADPNSIA